MIRIATRVAPPGPHRRDPCRPSRHLGWFAALALLLPGSSVRAAEAPEKIVDGLMLQIPASISTESTALLRSLLHGPLKRFEQDAASKEGRFVLICDFTPDGRRAECDDFGACYGLATYLR